MNLKKIILLAFLSSLMSCASILRGTSQVINVTSEPPGAEVLFDGQSMGVTPLSVSLAKNKYSTIMIKKQGYKTQMKQINKRFDVVALIGTSSYSTPLTTDAVNGSIYEYEPSMYHAVLDKSEDTTSSQKSK